MIDFENIKRYFVFLLGGGLGLLAIMLTTFVLTEFLLIDHMISYTVGLVAALVVNFVYHTRITFKFKNPDPRIISKFILVFVVITVLNWLLVFIFTKQTIMFDFKYYYLAAIFLITLLVSLINFMMNKLWVFRR